MSGVLGNLNSQVLVVRVNPMASDVTLVNLNGAGGVICYPEGDPFTLNIVPHETGTKVTVVNKSADSQNLLVNYGVAPFTTVTVVPGALTELFSVDGVWAAVPDVVLP
jgi:hypothetical protein